MATIPELKEQYESLDLQVQVRDEAAIDAECLLAFAYEYPEQESEVSIDTDEFTAVCPWTGLPRLWDPVRNLRAGRKLHRAEIPQVLPALFPRRGHSAGTRRQPYPQRPGNLLPTP